MHAAIVTFPGSNCDRDLAEAFRRAGFRVSPVWHKDVSLPDGVDIETYDSILVWCEAFGEFITAATYK